MEPLTYKSEDDLAIFVDEDGFVSLRSEPEGYDAQFITISPYRLPRVIEYLLACLTEPRAQPTEATP